MAIKKKATLWRDDSECAVELQKKLEDMGYNMRVKFSGSQPIFSYSGGFLAGYEHIQRFIG